MEEYGYPREVLQFDYKNNLGVCMNNVVWDIETGNVIKIAEGLEVTRALHGFHILTYEEITK